MDRIRKADASRHRLHGSRLLRRPVFGFAGSLAAVEEVLPTVRRLEGSCDAHQKVLRCFRYCKPRDELALGRVKESPFPNEAVSEPKDETVKVLSSRRLQLRLEMGDRNELPIDFRFLGLRLWVVQHPDTQLGTLAQGVKVGPGTRMPRHPACDRTKRKWRLESLRDPTSWQLEEEHQSEHPWRQETKPCFAGWLR